MILISIVLFLAGHTAGCLLFYFTHRFVFHGRLGKLPLLRKIRAIHTGHHARPYLLEKALFPAWAKVVVGLIMLLAFFVNLPFTIGVCSFFPVYSYRHWMAHNGSDAYWARHHMHHHIKDPKTNFGGIYPIVDKLFRTSSME